ncbi:AAA family ATPase [Planctomicrobium sp. SH664]|uniref:AAA family ATPase n=1 Tax=Planctomicrobium sp. SH664 TaxID=3448125 RepID=UPI003F5C1E5B
MIHVANNGFQRQPDGQAGNLPIVPRTLAEMQAMYPTEAEPVIEGIARLGDICNIVSASKVGKTWFVYCLALSIVTGHRWLGRRVKRGRVLIVDYELQPATIWHRLRIVAEAMGVRFEDVAEQVDVVSLRGQMVDLPTLSAKLVDRVPHGKYVAVILDALYRAMPAAGGENDNASMAAAYCLACQFGESTGAAWFLVHHSSKGDQSGKRVTDVGAGAGAQSRAADVHMILREHEENDCVVFAAVVRSFLPVEPQVLRWCFPLWQPQEHLNPLDLKKPKGSGDERQERQDRQGRETLIKAFKPGEKRNRKQLREATGMGHDRLNKLIRQLLDSEEIRIAETTTAKNNESVEWFSLTV